MNITWLLLVVVVFALGQAMKRPMFLRSHPWYLRVSDIKMCEDSLPDTSSENITITYRGTQFFISAVTTFHRSIERIEKAVFAIRRCNDAAEDRNCELFQTWRFGKEYCHFMEQKNMVWTPFIGAVKPKLRCPIAKGVYNLNNGTINIDVLQNIFEGIPVEKYYWRIRVEIYDHRMIMCFEYGLQVLRGKIDAQNK